MAKRQDEAEYAHATPLPIKGQRRLRLDAARRKDPMISKSAYLRLRKKAG